MATRSARTLSRHYAKLAVISSVPLILLILALGYVHYSEQRLRRLDALLVSLDERHRTVERTLAAMAEHTFLNSAGCRILGVSGPEEAIGQSYMDFVATRERDAAWARVLRVIEERQEIPVTERTICTPAGQEKDIEIMATPFLSGEGTVVALVIFRDITARKAMARAIRESEERFRAISEAIPLPVFISDAATLRLLYANPEAHSQLALGPDLRDGRTLPDICPDRRFRAGIGEVVSGRKRVESVELEVHKGDGERFWGRITTVPMKYQGGDALIHAIVDLSERLRAEAELARQRESFHQKEKIAALGSLLAGLAHELNNPLSVVSGQSLMLEDEVDDERIIQRARRIRDAAERCSRTVRTFLAMARSKATEREPVALNEAVRASLDLVSHSLQSSGVEVDLHLGQDLANVMADADQLHHLVSNLIVNAEHAMRETEPPRILTIRTSYEEKAKLVVLTVADNGPGVPKEILQRIFEPFFTTKPGTAGTGIGLALCRDIAVSHGGDISYSENMPRGAAFTVRLPLADSRSRFRSAETQAEAGGETGTILVVDDDEEVALTLADVLRRQGHEVDTVFGAMDGIDRARQKSYDIIISDVRMPDADGPDLYRALRPDIAGLDRRMMFMTGDTLRIDLETLVAGTTIPVIEKPLDPRAVAAMIAGKLRENRQARDVS